jgi:hypothetical protein
MLGRTAGTASQAFGLRQWSGVSRVWRVMGGKAADDRKAITQSEIIHMAKPAQQAAQPNTTFSPEQLQAYVDQAITKVLEVKRAQEEHKRSDDMEAATVKAFRRAGYKQEDIRPRENIKTYNLWLQDGFRVKPGETSVRVKTLRLFHASQVERLNAVEAKKALAELEAKKAKRTADKLPPISPVEMPKAQPAPKPPIKNAKVLIAEPGNA